MDQEVAKKVPRQAADPMARLKDLEDWASRIGWHVTVLYLALGVVVLKTIFDLLAWGDFIVTGR